MKTIFLTIALMMLGSFGDVQFSRADMPSAGELHLIKAKFYVSASGDDKNEGSTEKPFKTIERAQKAVRDLKLVPDPKGNWQYVLVLIRGNLTIDKTIVFGPADSAPDHTTVCYAAENDKDTSILSHGRELKNWKLENGIWKTPLPKLGNDLNIENLMIDRRISPKWKDPSSDTKIKPGDSVFDYAKNEIHYYPLPNQSLEKSAKIGFLSKGIIRIEGVAGKPVRGLEFHRLQFSHSSDNGGALFAEYARDLELKDCLFQEIDGPAALISTGCKDCYVVRCQFRNMTGDGLFVSGKFKLPSDENDTEPTNDDIPHLDDKPDSTTRIKIEKCLFEKGNTCGLILYAATHVTVRKNVFRDLHRTAITCVNSGGYHDICENHIYRCVQYSLPSAGILLQGKQSHTIIRLNRIHDLNQTLYKTTLNEILASVLDKPLLEEVEGTTKHGIFFGDRVENVTVENNTIYNILNSPIIIASLGKNIIKNNRLVSSPKVPVIQYNLTDPQLKSEEDPKPEDTTKIDNIEITTDKPWQIPPDDPAINAGYRKYDEKPDAKNTK